MAIIERREQDPATQVPGAALSHYPTAPIAVVLYTNEQFRDITRAPPWAGGAFDGIIRIPMRGALADAAEFDRVLAHEYTHALVYDLARSGVPTWLHEGLAVALERDVPPTPPPAVMSLGALGQSFGRLGDREAREATRSAPSPCSASWTRTAGSQ